MGYDLRIYIVEYRITYKHGKNISIDGLVATRWKSHNCGIIVSDAPLCDDMFFQVLYTNIHTHMHTHTYVCTYIHIFIHIQCTVNVILYRWRYLRSINSGQVAS